MQAKLVVTGGKATAKEIALKLPAIVGRAKEAGVRIVHSSVSRKHCEIYELEGALVVRDAGSTNGTYLGADRVEEQAVVKPGEELTIGPLTFRVEYDHKGKFPSLRKPSDKAADSKARKMPEIVFDNEEPAAPAPMTERHAKQAKAKPPQPKKKTEPAIEETLFFEPEAEVQAADESAAAVESPPADEQMDDFFASLAEAPPESPVDESPTPAAIEENVPAWGTEEPLASDEAPAIEDVPAFDEPEEIDDAEEMFASVEDIEDAAIEPAEAAPVAEDDAFAAWLGQSEPEAEEPAPEVFQPSEEVDEVPDAPAAAAPVAEEGAFAAWLSESQEQTPAEEPPAFEPFDEAPETAPEPVVPEPVAETKPAADEDAFAAWLSEPSEQAAEEPHVDEAPAFEPFDETPEAAPEPTVPGPVAEVEPADDEDAFAAWLNDSPEQSVEKTPPTFEANDETPDTADEPIISEPFVSEPAAEEDEVAPAAWLNEPEHEAAPEAEHPATAMPEKEPESIAFEPSTTTESAAGEDAFAAWLGEPAAAAPEPAEDMFAPAEEIELSELDIVDDATAPPIEFAEPVASEPIEFAPIEFAPIEFAPIAEAESDPALELELPPDLPEPPHAHVEEPETPLAIGEPMADVGTDEAEAAAWDFLSDAPVAETPPVLPAERVTEDAMPEAAAAMDELGLTPEAAIDSPASPLDTTAEDEMPFDAFVENEAFAENEAPVAPVAGDPFWAPDEVAAIEPSNEFESLPEENVESSYAEMFSNGAATAEPDMFGAGEQEPDFAPQHDAPAMFEPATFEPAEVEPPVAAAEAIGFDLVEPATPQSFAPPVQAFELQTPSAPAKQSSDVSGAPSQQAVTSTAAPAKRSWWPFGRKSREAAEKSTPQTVAVAQVAVRKPLASIPVDALATSESTAFAGDYRASGATRGDRGAVVTGRRRINIGEGPSGELDTLDVMFPPIETVPPVGSTTMESLEPAVADIEAEGAKIDAEGADFEPSVFQAASPPELETTLWASEPAPTIAFESTPAEGDASPWDTPEVAYGTASVFEGADDEEEIPILEFEEESADKSDHDAFMFADENLSGDGDTPSDEDAPGAFEEASEEPFAASPEPAATSMWDEDAIPVLDLDEAPESPVGAIEIPPDFGETSEPVASQESDDDLLGFLSESEPTAENEAVAFAADESSDIIEFSEEPPVGDGSLPIDELPAESEPPKASSSAQKDDDDLADFLRELGQN